jgi:pseudouridine synthase
MAEMKQNSTQPSQSPAEPAADGASVRLHKFLAQCGIGSRRQCEEFIRQGRVSVNGRTVREMGVRIAPGRDRVEFDGRPVVAGREPLVYYLFCKPAGFVTTRSDERGRRTIHDLLTDIPYRVFPVGRLDKDSEGLLLLTNDGELAHRLMHPSYRVEKEYRVEVEGYVTDEEIAKLEGGMTVDGEAFQPAVVHLLARSAAASHLTIVIREGRKRQVRRMCLAIGHPVRKLIRVREGSLRLGNMKPGTYRALTASELVELRREARLDGDSDEPLQ